MPNLQINELNGGSIVSPQSDDLFAVQRGTGPGSYMPVSTENLQEFLGAGGSFDYIIKSTGTTYSSVGAALAANPATPLNLFVDGRGAAVNEAANMVCAVGVKVTYIGSWVRNGYKFDFNSTSNVSLNLQSFGKGSTFLGSASAGGDEGGIMINKGTNVSLIMNDCVISNLSSKDDDGFINPNGDVSINNCEISLTDKIHSGLDFSECTTSSISVINSVRISGNGASCSWCYVAGVNDSISGLTFDASVGAGLATSTTATVITNRKALFHAGAGYKCNVNNLQVIPNSGVSTDSEYGIVISSVLENSGITSGACLAIYGTSNDIEVRKVDFGISTGATYTGGRYIQYQNGNSVTIRDCKNLTAAEDFGGTSSSWLFDNVTFSTGSSPSFQVGYTTITNCAFDALVTVAAYGCVLKDNTATGVLTYDEDDKNVIEDFRVLNSNLVEQTMFASSYEVEVITDPEVYSSVTTYSIDANVTYSGLVYKGIQDSNIDNQPDTSPTFWEATATATTQEFTAKYGKMYIIPGTTYAVNIICPQASDRKGDGFSVFPESLTQSVSLEAAITDTINGSATANIGNPTTTIKVTSLGGLKMISSGTTAPP